MRYRLRIDGKPVDVEMAASATVADLRTYLGAAVLYIDGRPVSDVAPAADLLVDGVEVSATPGSSLPNPQGPHLRRQGPRVRFNRPPRSAQEVLPPRPPGPPALADLPPFPGMSVTLSLIGGIVMAAVFGAAFVLFAVIAPMTAVGLWADRYLRVRRDRRRELAAYRNAVTAFRISLRQRRRRDPTPTLGAMFAGIGGPEMWSVRGGDPAFGRIVAGYKPDGTPTSIDLQAGLGLVGRPDDVAAYRRWLVLQAAIRFGPADLFVDVPASWAAWLPHRDGRAGLRIDPRTVAAASHRDALPSGCTVVLTVPRLGEVRHRGIRATWPAVSEDDMDTACRLLARYFDPELPDGGLPAVVSLTDIEGSPTSGRFVAAVGMAAGGPVVVDLDRDGPHLLVAGTTGSGKSEFLRTVVLSLAGRYRPEEVGFVLADFKGGAAFGPCVDLPHVAGLVTDLDGDLQRLVEALRGEVEDRERLVADRGVTGFGDLVAGELRRLVVVVDEFAVLAERYDEELGALVDLARRGRSLGMHLVLATQRPAGVVSPEIQSNMALRVCFRVADAADATDVIGDRRPAMVDRRSPGRGFLRFGAGEITEFQAARAGDLPVVCDAGRVPDVQALVDRLARDVTDPAEPMLVPAPESVLLETLPPLAIGIVDDPRRPRPFRWNGGNLLVVGGPATPARETLITVGVAVARHTDTAIYAVGTGLDDLERLAAVGAVVRPGETERMARLLEVLRSGDGMLLLVAYPDADLRQAVLELTGSGVPTVLAVQDAGQVTGAVSALFADRLVFGLGDPFGHLALGLPSGLRQGDGQAIHMPTLATVTVARADRIDAPARCRPGPILELPVLVPLQVLPEPERAGGGWNVAYGLGGTGLLEPVVARLRPGRLWVVTGPSGSGKTTVLQTMAALLGGRTTSADAASGEVLIVDDAHQLERVPDWDGAMVCAASNRLPFGHWLRDVLPEADGCALRPHPADGDLWGRPLSTVERHPGRGLHLERDTVLPVQAADVGRGTMWGEEKETGCGFG